MLIDDKANHIEESQIVEKQPLLAGVKLLAIEGSEKETQNEHEEPPENALYVDNSSCENMRSKKKRKHSDDDSPKYPLVPILEKYFSYVLGMHASTILRKRMDLDFITGHLKYISAMFYLFYFLLHEKLEFMHPCTLHDAPH